MKYVAPHAGAWIEIWNHQPLQSAVCVAPHAGAWIEIQSILDFSFKSSVAPHAGAWIEIFSGGISSSSGTMSLPTRERGLKCQCRTVNSNSHPVAPHAGAWIEMVLHPVNLVHYTVAPHAGAWIEIINTHLNSTRKRRRSPRGSVDWNLQWLWQDLYWHCRSPRGSAGWKCKPDNLPMGYPVLRQ